MARRYYRSRYRRLRFRKYSRKWYKRKLGHTPTDPRNYDWRKNVKL